MRVSYNWLKDYVDLDLNPAELAELLTQAGLEVDDIEYPGAGLEDLVIGEIIEIEQHPNADKLSVTKVNVGSEVLQIVCGAKNIFVGAKAPIARVGVTLPGDFKIGKAKLRGVESFGMICSEDELGLVEERQPGVMILEQACQPGDSFVQIMGLDDAVLVLDLTPNYAHCLSMLGVAREIAARREKKVVRPQIELQETGTAVTELAEIEIADEELCPRYTARVIRNVQVGESPLWLQQRLEKAGIRSINNVVDATNFVLMEMGQPLHAFDYDQIGGQKVVVRPAKAGETIVTLDDKERKLDPEVLCICDETKPICIAGVMGGANSEVTEQTTNVLLESAYFNPISVRKTARRYGIPSEASHRFERGVDLEAVIEASNRAAQLIAELAGGEIAAGIIDQFPIDYQPKKIHLRTQRVGHLLGMNFTQAEIKELLEKLEFSVTIQDEDLEVQVPGFRGDVEREADLVEEVARMYGYNNIPGQLPVSPYRMGKLTLSQLLEDEARAFMNAVGLSETMSFSFINPGVYDKLNLSPEHPWRDSLKLLNPLSEEYAVMRRTLLADLLRITAFNRKRQRDEVRVFELARVYNPVGKELPEEPRMLSAAVIGVPENDRWNQQAGGYFYLKGILDKYAEKYGLGALSYERAQHDSMHPGRTAMVKARGEAIGYLGEIHPNVLENFDLKNRVTVFELNFDRMVELMDQSRNFSDLPKFPASTRDIALLVGEAVLAQDIIRVISDAKGADYLEKVELFDLYQGSQVPEGKKSLAFALNYRAQDRTLTDQDVDRWIEKTLQDLKDKLDAEIRK